MSIRSRLSIASRRFLVLLLLSSGWRAGFAETPLSALVGNDLAWDNLPVDLTAKVVPLLDKDDLRLKFGKTPDGLEYLSVAPPHKSELSFGVRDPESLQSGYIVSAKRAYYWPDRGLLRFEREVIVSASTCRLEGNAFDLHLRHNTTRLSGPNIVVSLTEGLLPIESDSLRIAGLDSGREPIFEWDPRTTLNDRPLLHRPPPKRYRIRIQDGGKVLFEGQAMDIAAFEAKVRNLAAKEPDSTFSLELSPSAGTDVVKKVKKTLEKSGFDAAETTVAQPTLEGQTLRPEHEHPTLVEPDISAPSGKGAALLWVEGESRFLLNGKIYDAGSVRALMRRLGRVEPERPIIVAGAETVPLESLRSLAQDLRSFGFKFVQLGVDPAKAKNR